MSNRRIGGVRLAWIKAFVAVAKYGSQARAAQELGCSQSAISRYIGDLETWIRRPLFGGDDRQQLTKKGKEFLADAERILVILENAREPIDITPKRRKDPNAGNALAEYRAIHGQPKKPLVKPFD